LKMYNVTSHAIKRAVERLGQPEFNAANHLISLMQTAYYNGETAHPSGKMMKVYDHYKSRTRIIVSPDDSIITAYKISEFESPKSSVFIDDIKRLVERKFNAYKREFKKQYRSLEIELAEINYQIAQFRLNKAKARSPKVQASLQTKIDALSESYYEIKTSIDMVENKFEEIKRGAESYL
jgi:hypothetical protein